MLPNNKNKFTYVGYTIVILLIFGAGFMLGTAQSVKKYLGNESGTVDINKIIDLYGKTRSSEVSFDQYWNIWNTIKEKHVQQPVDEVSLFYSSLEGLVAGLNDPYSVYFPPEKAEAFAKDLAGEFEGIGAEIGIRENQLVIIAPLPDSPAENAGLTSGDKVLAVDGVDTASLSLDEAITKIRGPRGTEVKLTITRNGIESAQDIIIIRDTISISTVEWEMKDDATAYMRIGYFNDSTWKEFDTVVKEILAQKPLGLILDLRGNPGGYLDTSVQVASEWIQEGVIVGERFNDGAEKTYSSKGKHRFVGVPTIVLIDEGTASGSEIVAGALQDHNAATIIGTTSFGKGSVQDFELLPDGSALKLTVARWYTPDGRQIDETGIEPDEVVEEMFVQKEDTSGENVEDYIDKGLERALQLLPN